VQGRRTFDTSEDQKGFGAIVIYFGGVQDKVSNKYDSWHREILNRFGTTLLESLRAFKAKATDARHQLEKLSVDANDDVTLFVTEI